MADEQKIKEETLIRSEEDFKETEKMYKAGEFDGIEKQVAVEYKMANNHQRSKRSEHRARLKLYNNQRRDPEAAGDTTLFTIFQTVLASLYDDKLMAKWRGREEGDRATSEDLNALTEFDYDQMDKDKIDFDWIWDTLFFGRGFVALHEFIRDPEKNVFVPVPEVLDPLLILRDPYAVSVNGVGPHRRNAARFLGRPIRVSKYEMVNNENFFIPEDEIDELDRTGDMHSILERSRSARDDAQGRQEKLKQDEEKLGANTNFEVLEWYTNWEIDGEPRKAKIWLGNERKKLLGAVVFDENEKDWAIIDRQLYPTSHDWDGTSIPDLTEDKQRQRAIAKNLGLKAIKSDLYPTYIYDKDMIRNRNDLNIDFNKFIPAESKNKPISQAIQPITKAKPNLPLLQFILQSLDISAQKATATPEIKQGSITDEKRTLGEVNLVAANTDTRYSLSAKIFGWSEKRFWQQWYSLYKDHFAEEIDEKTIRIDGAFGPQFRDLTRSNIVTENDIDPDLEIKSKRVSRSKMLENRQLMTEYLVTAVQDPNANKRWAFKKLGELNGMEVDEIDRLFPPTVDERTARKQNEKFGNNDTAPVLKTDDHNVHLEIHSQAPDTPAKYAHMEAHREALTIKKEKPEWFPEDQQQAALNPQNEESDRMNKIMSLFGGNRSRNRAPIAPSQSPS